VIVRFHIPGGLREFSGGRSQIEIEHPASTLNSALSALWIVCPGMRDRVMTEQGGVRQHINIFIGDENVRYTGGLATKVSADSVISIVPAVSGGRQSNQDSRSFAVARRVRGIERHC
jgi:molybdopterin converting factor small subunit